MLGLHAMFVKFWVLRACTTDRVSYLGAAKTTLAPPRQLSSTVVTVRIWNYCCQPSSETHRSAWRDLLLGRWVALWSLDRCGESPNMVGIELRGLCLCVGMLWACWWFQK